MAKKQRRKQQPQRTAPQTAPASTSAAAPVVRASATSQERRPSTPASTFTRAHQVVTWAELQERYSYVNRELKQIGILAGSFLVVLLILTAILG